MSDHQHKPVSYACGLGVGLCVAVAAVGLWPVIGMIGAVGLAYATRQPVKDFFDEEYRRIARASKKTPERTRRIRIPKQ